MLPIKAVLDYLKFVNPELTDIVLELRNIIAEETLEVTEEFQRGGLTYYDARKGGHVSAGVCMIHVLENEIHLAFAHGAFLPDKQRLLIDEGKRKAKRYIRLTQYQAVPWDAVRELIRDSSQFDPYTLKL